MKLAISPCLTCGADITQRQGSGRIKKYCSRSCWPPSHRTPAGSPRNCQSCGTAMQTASGDQPGYCRTCRIAGKDRAPRLMQQRVCKECGGEYETARKNGAYCSSSCRPNKLSAAARGYGPSHQRLRLEWKSKVEAGGVMCCLCSLAIDPDEAWHLDHTEDRTAYRGVAHQCCNLRDAQVRSAVSVIAQHYDVDRDALLAWLRRGGHLQSLSA